MSDKTKVGIIGVGQIGEHHVKAYAGNEAVEIVAASDLDETRLAHIAATYNIADTYTDFRELLARDDVEAVDVCLHNNLHMPVATAALEAGKHVYCEKPMAGAYADAERMLETARSTGRKLAIQLATLFARETRVARALLDDGLLGNVYHARSTGFRRRGRPFVDGYGAPSFVKKDVAAGGALYDMGVYHIAQVLYLLDNPAVERISGKTYQKTAMNEARKERSGYDVEELGLGFVRLADEVTLDIIESWAALLDGFEGSSLLGSEGGLRLNPFGFFHTLCDMDANVSINLDTAAARWNSVHEVGDVYESPSHHWIAALQGRVELLPTAEIALNTMLISEGIYLSNRLGREVTGDEVREQSVSTALKV